MKADQLCTSNLMLRSVPRLHTKRKAQHAKPKPDATPRQQNGDCTGTDTGTRDCLAQH